MFVHKLEKVYGSPNTQQGRQPRNAITTTSLCHHESMCQLWQHICRSTHSTEPRSQLMDQGRVQYKAQPRFLATRSGTTTNLLQHLRARVRRPANVLCACPPDALARSSTDDPRKQTCPVCGTSQTQQTHSRDGHDREPRIRQARRQQNRRGTAKPKAAPTNSQSNQEGRRGPRLNDSSGQAQGRQGRTEESQQSHAQHFSQSALDDAGLVLDGLGRTAGSVKPRSRQHAETDANLRGESATGRTRVYPRPTVRLGIPGSDKDPPSEAQRSWSANGAGNRGLLGPPGTASASPNLRRGEILQAGQNVQSRCQENCTQHSITRATVPRSRRARPNRGRAKVRTSATNSHGKGVTDVPGRALEDVKIMVGTFLAERSAS